MSTKLREDILAFDQSIINLLDEVDNIFWVEMVNEFYNIEPVSLCTKAGFNRIHDIIVKYHGQDFIIKAWQSVNVIFTKEEIEALSDILARTVEDIVCSQIYTIKSEDSDNPLLKRMPNFSKVLLEEPWYFIVNLLKYHV